MSDTYRILTPEPDTNEFTPEYEGLTKWQLKRALKAEIADALDMGLRTVELFA